MQKFKVTARNKTVLLDQTSTVAAYGYQSPWKTVIVEARNPKHAIKKSKSAKRLPTRLYTDHQIEK
jgi:hypothetical protein